MRFFQYFLSSVGCALVAPLLFASIAQAGGFSIREQSTSGMGSSFAGNAAGYDLSTIYWNPAGVAIAGPGITTESHAALIIPQAEIDSLDTQPLVLGGLSGLPNSIDEIALVPSSYMAWRINDKMTIGYGFNAPFGLATEADNPAYAGQYEFRAAQLKTFNFNPVVGYQVTPTLSVGVGLQVQYAELELYQAAVTPATPNPLDPTAVVEGDDIGIGFTAGLLWRPMQGTSIGVGYRSRVDNTLEGFLRVNGAPFLTQPVKADFDLPDILTVSLRQDISPNMRLLGTFEWTNWSILQTVRVFNRTTGAQVVTLGGPLQVEANWDDGYFLSGGLEFDWSDQLTVRGGVAHEWSPVQEASQRLVAVPDADRIWLSVGATYKWSETTSFDFAYTHIFVDDAPIMRPSGFIGNADDSSVDIIALSYKMKWGPGGPFGILNGLAN